MNLWKTAPGLCEETPAITEYLPEKRRSNGAVVIFPGGGYGGRAPHEGEGYARFFESQGIPSFVVDYRVAPHRFPLPLLDARRAVRFVRANAARYGIDPEKIAVMGSSAGGHLAAMLSTYTKPIDHEGLDETDAQPYLPNAQILCYPVITPDPAVAHTGSFENLFGTYDPEAAKAVDPVLNAVSTTPPAFMWHTADDDGVNVINSYRYATALRQQNVAAELHVFPHGPHGMGLAADDPSVSQWTGLLLNWLRWLGWLK